MEKPAPGFSEKLKWLREQRGLSQRKLLEELRNVADEKDRLSISPGAYAGYEKAAGDGNPDMPEKLPSIETARKLAKFYGVSLDWLAGENDILRGASLKTYRDFAELIMCAEGIRARSEVLPGYILYEKRTISKVASHLSGTEIPENVQEAMIFVVMDETLVEFAKEYRKISSIKVPDDMPEDIHDMWLARLLDKLESKEIPVGNDAFQGGAG